MPQETPATIPPAAEDRDPRISEAQAVKMAKAAKRIGYTPDWYWTIEERTATGPAAIRGLRVEGPVFDESEVIDRLNPGVYRGKLYAKGGGLVYTTEEFTVSATPLREEVSLHPLPPVAGKVESPSELEEMRATMRELREELAQRRRASVGLSMADLPAIAGSIATTIGSLAPLFKRDTLTLKDVLPLVTKSGVTEAIEGMAALQKLAGEQGGGSSGGGDDTALIALLAPIVGKLIDQRQPANPPAAAQVRPVPRPGPGANGAARPGLAAGPGTTPAAGQGPRTWAGLPDRAQKIGETAHTEPHPHAGAAEPPQDTPAAPATVDDIHPIAAAILFAGAKGLSPMSIAGAVWELWVQGAGNDEHAALGLLDASSPAEIADDWIKSTPQLALIDRAFVASVAECMADLARGEDEDDEEEEPGEAPEEGGA